jgi:hypothetical protein
MDSSNKQNLDTQPTTNLNNQECIKFDINIDFSFFLISCIYYVGISSYFSYKKSIRLKELEIKLEKLKNEGKILDEQLINKKLKLEQQSKLSLN